MKLASRALVRPLPLAAIALLIVNDHVLKAACPGVITGKLSDFAGLACFPLLLAAVVEQVGVRRGLPAVIAAALATGIAFAAIKLSTTAGDAFRSSLAVLQWPFRAAAAGHPVPLGRVTLAADPTDLVALVALWVPLREASAVLSSE